jgi:hypothetical protein
VRHPARHGPHRGRADFGTVGGGLNLHTVAELSDLLRAKDQLIPDLEKQFNAFRPTWAAKDPKAVQSFQVDLTNLKSRYHLTSYEARALVAATPSLVENITPAETLYANLLQALQRTSGVVAPGDLQDLWIRYRNAKQMDEASKGQPLTEPYEPPSSTIQPRKDSDWDENRIKDLSALEVFEAKVGKILGVALIVGGVAVAGIYVMPLLPLLGRLLPKRRST